MNLRELYHQLKGTLTPEKSHEAETVLMHALEKIEGKTVTRSQLFMSFDQSVDEQTIDYSLEIAQKRKQGHPLQYLTQRQFFFRHDYLVRTGVLIPRPETEILIATAIEKLSEKAEKPAVGIEIGLGSGILSIELLDQFRDLKMYASEVSDLAIEIAEHNLQSILKNELDRLAILKSPNPLSVFECFNVQADFIISNPPYLVDQDDATEEVFGFEPHHALFSQSGDPDYFYKKIAQEADRYLKPDGMIFLEISHHRSDLIKKIFLENQWFVEVHPDLTQRDRVLTAWRQ